MFSRARGECEEGARRGRRCVFIELGPSAIRAAAVAISTFLRFVLGEAAVSDHKTRLIFIPLVLFFFFCSSRLVRQTIVMQAVQGEGGRGRADRVRCGCCVSL